MLNWWDKNFASCELGDERLSDRAYSIGKKLSQGFGKALSEIFKTGSELKRAYEFSPIAKQRQFKFEVQQFLIPSKIPREEFYSQEISSVCD
jgi:Transposase DNA-binding